jgi:hypothetical protein
MSKLRDFWMEVVGVDEPKLLGGSVATGSSVSAGQAAVTATAGPAGNTSVTATAGPAGPQPVPVTTKIAPADMKDEDIAAEIMDKQAAILVGWQTALQVFDKTMSSSADKEATPQFQKVVVDYFADKLMGEMMKKAPGSAEVIGLLKALDAEYKRAAAAGASATLRDFVNQHARAIGALYQKTLDERQPFISAVRAKREAVEAPRPGKGGSKGGKWEPAAPTKADDDYAMMRMDLLDMLAGIDKVRSGSTPEALFKVLSDEWVRNATVNAGMGVHLQATVIIRLNPDYSMKDAHIEGSGGQKLAEELLKEFPDGVDVFGMQAPRRILLLAQNGWPEIILSLDANNRDVSTGSIAEGRTDLLYKYVMSHRLPPTKNLHGD